MADTSQTLALIILGQRIAGKVVRTINRRSALLSSLPVIPGSGQNCSWSVELDGQVGEHFAEGADAANFGSDAQAQATLGWARTRSNFHVTSTARKAARSGTAGPEGMEDLIGRNMENSSAKVASLINGALFSGSGSGGAPTGLDTAIATANNTYAGIDRSVSTSMNPFVVDPGSLTTPTFQQIRNDRTNIYKQSGEYPDVAVVEPLLFDKIGGLFDNVRRLNQIVTSRGTIVLQGGFEAIEFDGMYFMKDKDATANRIYYLNSNYVEIQYLPPDVPELGDLSRMGDLNDGFGSLPLGIITEKLAKNGASDRYQSYSEYQLVVRKPSACGARLNVDAS